MMCDDLPIRIRSIKLDDVESCISLSATEGWNQTEKDWKLLIGNPRNICLLAQKGKRVLGSGTAMNYSNDIAWIGMILVDKEFRGQGISKMILKDLIVQLHPYHSVKLDATPAGQSVYEKFNFTYEFLIHRMTTPSVVPFPIFHTELKPLAIQWSDIPEIIALDRLIFGADRTTLVHFLFKEYTKRAWCIKRNGSIVAFAFGRHGRKFDQIGPVFANSQKEAQTLITYILQGFRGKQVVMDILADKSDLVNWLISIGFSVERNFVRMYLNSNPCSGKAENQFLICGPEFG